MGQYPSHVDFELFLCHDKYATMDLRLEDLQNTSSRAAFPSSTAATRSNGFHLRHPQTLQSSVSKPAVHLSGDSHSFSPWNQALRDFRTPYMTVFSLVTVLLVYPPHLPPSSGITSLSDNVSGSYQLKPALPRTLHPRRTFPPRYLTLQLAFPSPDHQPRSIGCYPPSTLSRPNPSSGDSPRIPFSSRRSIELDSISATDAEEDCFLWVRIKTKECAISSEVGLINPGSGTGRKKSIVTRGRIQDPSVILSLSTFTSLLTLVPRLWHSQPLQPSQRRHERSSNPCESCTVTIQALSIGPSGSSREFRQSLPNFCADAL
ncbi:hypothetical protein CVT26_001502 [Gymnopilus dilepis]|uniref:Uncharacterized protein n=1 Tax=Gymnopilus dilepis TaxID=231916 RepID=A0A409YXJ2_9AGAR|nr:hypothetical protein CVT26_001502 [Gymnopilus dilepis]